MRKAASTLTEQELEIMKIVWELEQATVRQVYEKLLEQREIAYTTVLTMMQVLERKGHLTKSLDDKAHVYRSSKPRQKVIGGMVHEFLQRVFNGSAEPLLMHLVEDDKLTAQDIDRLRKKLKGKP